VRNAIYTNKEVGSGKWRRGEGEKSRRGEGRKREGKQFITGFLKLDWYQS